MAELRVSLIDCFTYMCRNIATGKPAAVVCYSVLRAPIFPFFSLRTCKCYITRTVRLYFRRQRTRVICARDSGTVRTTLEAILKIYTFTSSKVGFISAGEFLRIRSRCVLLWYDLCIGCPRSHQFFPAARICIRKKQKEQLDY